MRTTHGVCRNFRKIRKWPSSYYRRRQFYRHCWKELEKGRFLKFELIPFNFNRCEGRQQNADIEIKLVFFFFLENEIKIVKWGVILRRNLSLSPRHSLRHIILVLACDCILLFHPSYFVSVCF